MDASFSNRSVALVINTYEQAHFLSASIESAARQTVRFNEVIVVDDGSSDNPASVVSNYPGVRLIRQSNAGLAAARNTGLDVAASDYIIFLDADDLLTPDRGPLRGWPATRRIPARGLCTVLIGALGRMENHSEVTYITRLALTRSERF